MKTENSKRIITATILVGVIFSAIFFLDSFLFSVVVGLIVSAAVWEWCHLCKERNALAWKIALVTSVGGGVPILMIFQSALPWILGIALIWWVSVAIIITRPRTLSTGLSWQAKRWHALLIIFPAAVAITGLHEHSLDGRWYVTSCLLIIWTTDTCAYMVGRVYGKTLLAPGISPGKTVEGVGGGLVGAFIVGLILYEVLPTGVIFSRFNWMALVIATSGFSIIGDLSESIYKRAANVKDSGWILPGHGGILDRMDSTFASSPVFVAGMLYMVS